MFEKPRSPRLQEGYDAGIIVNQVWDGISGCLPKHTLTGCDEGIKTIFAVILFEIRGKLKHNGCTKRKQVVRWDVFDIRMRIF